MLRRGVDRNCQSHLGKKKWNELGTILRQNRQIGDDLAISDAIQAPEPRW